MARRDPLCWGGLYVGVQSGPGYLHSWWGRQCQGQEAVWQALGLSPLSPALCKTLTLPGGAENQMCPGRAHLSRLILEAPSASASPPTAFTSSALEENFCLPRAPSDHLQPKKKVPGHFFGQLDTVGALNYHHLK